MTAMSPAPEAITPEPEDGEPKGRDLRSWLPTVRDTALAILLALIVGAFLIAISDDEVIEALDSLFSNPGSFFVYAGDIVKYSAEAIWDAYKALVRWRGRFRLVAPAHARAVRAADLRRARRHARFPRRPVQHRRHRARCWSARSPRATSDSPTTCRRGSTSSPRSPPGCSPPHSGAAIVGVLKAQTGAHEVITTIMLNQVARFTVLYFLAKEAFQRPGQRQPA